MQTFREVLRETVRRLFPLILLFPFFSPFFLLFPFFSPVFLLFPFSFFSPLFPCFFPSSLTRVRTWVYRESFAKRGYPLPSFPFPEKGGGERVVTIPNRFQLTLFGLFPSGAARRRSGLVPRHRPVISQSICGSSISFNFFHKTPALRRTVPPPTATRRPPTAFIRRHPPRPPPACARHPPRPPP